MAMVFQPEVTDAQVELCVPEVVVAPRPRRVGPRQGNHGCHHQQDATGRLDAEEPHDGSPDGARQRPVATQPSPF